MPDASVVPVWAFSVMDTNGEPIENAKLNTYVAGSVNTALATFEESTLTTPHANPVLTDAAGRFPNPVYAQNKAYKFVITDAADNVLQTIDPWLPNSLANPAETIAALTAITKATLANGDEATVSGYNTQGDGGGGDFFWNAASTATENGGTIFESDEGGTGRWFRNVAGFPFVFLLWFGAVGDGVIGSGGTDDNTSIQNAVTYTKSIAGSLVAPAKTFRYTAQILLDSPMSLIGEYNGVHNSGDTKGTIFLKDGNFDGIEITNSAGVRLSDFCSQGDTGNGGQGIKYTQCGRSSTARVTCQGHGGDGMEYNNGNLSSWEDCFLLNNTGKGFWANGLATPDTNVAVFSNIDARGNGGIGVDMDNIWNAVGNFTCQSNDTGIRINNCRGSNFSIYAENNTTADIEYTNHTNLEGNHFNLLFFGSIIDNMVKPEQNHVEGAKDGADTRTSFIYLNAQNLRSPSQTGISGAWQMSHPSNGLYTWVASQTSANQTVDMSNSVAGFHFNFTIDGTLTSGEAGVEQGVLHLQTGAGGNEPAYRRMGSADGTLWYEFMDNAGNSKRHSTIPTANTDGAVVGALQGDGSELTIASGVITATSGYHLVDTEGDASSDNLDTITAGIFVGQTIVLAAADDARTVTITDSVGNINTAQGGSFALDALGDKWTGIWTGTSWDELSRSNNDT